MEDRSREMKFDVIIIEHLSKVFRVNAKSEDEALKMVREAYLVAGEIDGKTTVLDADCFNGADFEANEVSEEE